RAVFNLENALAATAAAFVLGVPVAVIRRGLRTFGSDHSHNPGRLNVCRLGRVTVIVDYGHNAPAFRRVAEFARSLRPRRLLGVIGVPGDRGDEQIVAAGEVAGSGFDELFIKEDRDLRGRAPEEVARLLYKGARRGGMPPSLLHIIPDEIAAVKEALKRACPGDVVVVFYEKLEPVMEVLASAEKELLLRSAEPTQALLQT
ncbi:MAG: glutamate ligase domain-containing protein, partial [Thermacetogeniaceae bacterium]